MLSEETVDFEKCFGIPAGHTLRRSDIPSAAGAQLLRGRREHEEYDRDGNLVAVYESWVRRGDRLTFVKYSPYGWVLSISGRSPRFPPPKTRTRPEIAA